jgi:aconitase A
LEKVQRGKQLAGSHTARKSSRQGFKSGQWTQTSQSPGSDPVTAWLCRLKLLTSTLCGLGGEDRGSDR